LHNAGNRVGEGNEENSLLFSIESDLAVEQFCYKVLLLEVEAMVRIF